MKSAIVCGSSGFIGSHLVRRLKSEGYWVRGVDLKYPEFSKSEADDFVIFDLRNQHNYQLFIHHPTDHCPSHFDEVYQLAADMGGAGYIFTGEHDAEIMHNSATINLNVLDCLKKMEFKGKIFYSSSACMYPQELQQEKNQDLPNLSKRYALAESDAYPGNPDSEYGWEKLFSERLFLAYQRNTGLNVRIARFHNIYGPEGTYKGGREKAPAAICRKVASIADLVTPEINGWIDVWGDGNQTRSFLYIDDCIDAVRLLMESDFKQPINIGSEEMVSINELAGIAISCSGKAISIKHIDGPQGVRGRNSDNTLIEMVLNWKPTYSLAWGLSLTYNWIKSQYE